MRTITVGLPACAMLVSAALSAAGEPQAQSPLPDYDIENAGLARGSQPETLTWDRIYALAVIRARSRRGAFAPMLDPAALAQEAARQGVTDFARFRIQFHSNGPFRDPGPPVFELERRLVAIHNARRNVAFHERVHKLIVDRSHDNSSGPDHLDVATVFTASLRAREKLTDEIVQFRDELDDLKFRLGLSPGAPVILDRQNFAAFLNVFDSVASSERDPQKRPGAFADLIARFPDPGEVIVNGEPILVRIEKDPDRMEEVLAAAVRAALKSRSERDQVPTQPNSGVQLELRVRRGIRGLFEKRLAYQAEKRCYELAIRMRDQTLERLTAAAAPPNTSRPVLLEQVIAAQAHLVDAEDRLIGLWTSFRAERLALYHDLGVLPYNDWKAFLADLKAERGLAGRGAPAKAPKPTAPNVPGPQALPNPPGR